MKTVPGEVTEVIKNKMPGVELKPVSYHLQSIPIDCYLFCQLEKYNRVTARTSIPASDLVLTFYILAVTSMSFKGFSFLE